MEQFYSSDKFKYLIEIISFVLLLAIVFVLYRFLFKVLKRRVALTSRKFDDFILELFKIPTLWFTYWVLLEIFTHIFLSKTSSFSTLLHINTILLIFSIAWIAIQMVRASSYYLQNRRKA